MPILAGRSGWASMISVRDAGVFFLSGCADGVVHLSACESGRELKEFQEAFGAGEERVDRSSIRHKADFPVHCSKG